MHDGSYMDYFDYRLTPEEQNPCNKCGVEVKNKDHDYCNSCWLGGEYQKEADEIFVNFLEGLTK